MLCRCRGGAHPWAVWANARKCLPVPGMGPHAQALLALLALPAQQLPSGPHPQAALEAEQAQYRCVLHGCVGHTEPWGL